MATHPETLLVEEVPPGCGWPSSGDSTVISKFVGIAPDTVRTYSEGHSSAQIGNTGLNAAIPNFQVRVAAPLTFEKF